MGDENPAPETGATEQTPPETGATETEPTVPIQLPEDHPLVKALKATRDELKELQDAKKTDIQRVTDDLTAERDRAGSLQTEVHQLRAALKHEIALEDIDLLGTGTAEEIEGRAKRLADREADRKKKGNVVPKEGSTPSAVDNDDRAAVRAIFGGD